MNRTRHMMLAAVVLLAGVGGIYGARQATHARSDRAQTTAEGQRVRWPLATELRYRLAWRTSSKGHLLSGGQRQAALAASGESALEGTLVLKVARADAHRTTLLASFTDLAVARFVVGGAQDDAQVVPEAIARDRLVGPCAALEVDDRGHLVELRVPQEGEGMFADVMHALASELSFELAEDDAISWKTEERTVTGIAQSSYRFDTTERGTTVERSRDGYSRFHALRSLEGAQPTVEGKTTLSIDANRLLEAVATREHVRVVVQKAPVLESSTELTLTLASRAPFAFSAEGEREIASFEVHAPGGDHDPRAVDRVLAKSFSRGDLTGLVQKYAAAGSFERGQLARAAAFLRLHPEECATLESLFERDKTSRGRSMVFDVLSSAGSPEAQASMRRLLDAPGAREDTPLHQMLVQRFALVGAPTAESIGYLRDLERRSNPELARVALVSRGAALGKRIARGDRDAEIEARELLARARMDLAAAPVSDRDALVKAIGNMRHPDAASALARHAKDPDAGVRASVATALGNTKKGDPKVTKILYEMMGDKDSFVARSAIGAHLGRRLTSGELGVFAEHVRSTQINTQADSALAAAIVQHAKTDAGKVKEVLETLLARAPENSEQAGRLRAAIHGLSG